jgi:hypothetical protein
MKVAKTKDWRLLARSIGWRLKLNTMILLAIPPLVQYQA